MHKCLDNKSSPNSYLLIILFIAVLLRLNGIEWGLPNLSHPNYTYHPDEVYLLSWAQMLYDGFIIPKQFIYGGTFYLTTLQLANYLGQLITPFAGGTDFFNTVLLGRCFGIFYAILTIYFTYLIARTLYNPVTGLIAAFLLSIFPAHIFWAQRIRPDELFTLLAVLNVYLATRILKKEGSKNLNLILGGCILGISIATRFPAAIFSTCYIAALISLQIENKEKWYSFFFNRYFIVAAGGCIVSYALASPHTFIFFDDFMNGMRVQWTYQSDPFVDAIGRGPVWMQYIVRILPQSLGYAFYILTLPALILVCFKRTTNELLLLSLIVPYFFLLTKASWVVVRYTMPLLPFIAIFISLFLTELLQKKWLPQIIVIAVFLFATSWTITSDLVYANAIKNDPRDKATLWLSENVPHNSNIGAFVMYPGDLFSNPSRSQIHNWYYYDLKNNTVAELDTFLSQNFDFIIINKTLLNDAIRLKEQNPNKKLNHLAKWVSSANDYQITHRFSNNLSLMGINFTNQFSSLDYMISLPDILILEKRR